MATLKKYDFTGKEIGSENIDDNLLVKKANSQMVKDYIVALCKNARQWSANTKTRSEVNKVKQKPQQQKGLGRARQGFLGAPQFKGGGVVFGPKPKFDQHVKINRREKRAVIKTLLVEKFEENAVILLDPGSMEKPKTKTANNFFKKLEIDNKKVLVIGINENNYSNVVKSVRNIPKKFYTYLSKVNGYELIHTDYILVMDSAFEGFVNLLSGKVGA